MHNPSSTSTILSWKEAALLAENCRKAGGLVVTTNGCFDLLHKGHVSYLQQARSLGDLLIVGLNSDESVKKIKGPERPLNNETDRAFVLSALRCIDGVCVFSEETPVEWLKTIRPHIHVKGGDWVPEKMPENATIRSWGGKIITIPYVDGYSTTSLIAKSKTVR